MALYSNLNIEYHNEYGTVKIEAIRPYLGDLVVLLHFAMKEDDRIRMTITMAYLMFNHEENEQIIDKE
jgi:hypothetical protein